MRTLTRALSGLAVLAVALAALAQAAALVGDAIRTRMADAPTARPAQERVFAVQLITVEAGTHHPAFTAYGEVRSRRALDIVTAAGGRVTALGPGVEEGARVEEGALLVQLDPTAAHLSLRRAETDLADARADAREAERALALARDELAAAEDQVALRERALARQTDLRDRNVGAAASFDEAELALSAARQAVLARRQAIAAAEARIARAATAGDRAQIAAEEARRALDETELRAPFGGTVATLDASVGAQVTSGEPLARLIDTDALEVVFQVSTPQFARLVSGGAALPDIPVEIALAGTEPPLIAEGQITRSAAELAEGETGRTLFADMNRAPGFRPGDFVTVRVTEPPLTGTAFLPSTALGPDGGVLAVDADDRLEERPVTVLRRDGDRILIAADALEGLRVVASRTPLLGRGTKVRELGSGPAAEDSAALASGRHPRG